MRRTPQMIAWLGSGRVGSSRESSRKLLGLGRSRLTTPPLTVAGASRAAFFQEQHHLIHGISKRWSSAYEASASEQPVPSSGSTPLAAAEEVPLDPVAPLPSPSKDQSDGEAREFGDLEVSLPSSTLSESTFLVPTPNGGATVKISMPKSTAEAIAMNKTIQEKARQKQSAPQTVGDSPFASASAEGEVNNPPRTLLVRPPNAYPLKVTVPSTTAEAVAMNRSIQERTRHEAATRGDTAAEAVMPPASGVGDTTAAVAAIAKATPKEMVVTPTARSNSLKIPVPATTAEAMAMNKAMRSRFREAAADQSPAPGRSSGWMQSRRRRDSAGWRGGKYSGFGTTEKSNALDSSGDRTGGWIGGSLAVAGQEESGAGSIGGRAFEALGEKSFDGTILDLSRKMQWSQIIRVWEEIEEREKEGVKVSLGPQAYEDVLSALIEHPDVAVVARCGAAFDHLVESGRDVKPVICNLYMKGCSLAKLGTRAVALMEGLDRLPVKNFKPNPHFFYNLLTATSAEGMVTESKLYYGLMRDMGFVANNRVFNSLTDMYIEAGCVVEALMVFEHAHQAGHKPRDNLANKLTYTCMRHGDAELMHKALDLLQITGNAVVPLTVQNVLYMATRKRDAELATKIWVAAQGWGHTFSDVDYSLTVQAFMAVGKDEMALATLVQAFKDGRTVTRKTLTFCAHRLSISNNRLDGAYYTLTSLKQNGETVPVEAVNTIIVGCAIRGGVDRCFSTAEALPAVFELQPNLDTYNALMHVLSKMRKQEIENASLGIGMSLLDKMDSEGVKPDEETFISLVDLACSSEGLSEAVADELVERMTTRYGLRLDQDVVDTLANAFHDRGEEDVAQAWAARLPPLDGASLSPDGAAPTRFRRTADGRKRYAGFHDGLSRVKDRNGNNQRLYGGERGGDRFQRDGQSSERHSQRRPGVRGGTLGSEVVEGVDRVGLVDEGGSEGNQERSPQGWAEKYTRR